MKNIPTKIYIQIGEDVNQNDNIDFNELEELTWSPDRIFKTDIVYYLKTKNKKAKK